MVTQKKFLSSWSWIILSSSSCCFLCSFDRFLYFDYASASHHLLRTHSHPMSRVRPDVAYADEDIQVVHSVPLGKPYHYQWGQYSRDGHGHGHYDDEEHYNDDDNDDDDNDDNDNDDDDEETDDDEEEQEEARKEENITDIDQDVRHKKIQKKKTKQNNN